MEVRTKDIVSIETLDLARQALFAYHTSGRLFGFLCNELKDAGVPHDEAPGLVLDFVLDNPNIPLRWRAFLENGYGALWAPCSTQRRVAALAMYHWLGAVKARRLKEGSL